MVFKKKKTTRCKSKTQPHWKDLALLLSKKRQLNVVLRREIIHPTAASISTSEGNDSMPDSSSSETHNENVPKEDYLVNGEDVRTKQGFVAPKPTLGKENNNQGSASSISSEDHPPEFSFKGQLTSSSDTDKTYNVSINDFKSFLEAATKQSDVRLSIENTHYNLNTSDDQISTEDNDLEPKNLRSKNHLKSSIIENRKKKEQHIPEKNTLTRRLRNKSKIEDELQENELNQNQDNFTIAELEKKPKETSTKTKIDGNKQKDNRSRKRPAKSNVQNKESIKNARENGCQHEREKALEQNIGDINFNLINDNCTHASEMPVNEAVKLKCHTEKNKTSRDPKSIAHELRLLRRKINEVCKSQKQVQAELQSTLNDRFEMFGKTIAACLRQLPRFESQSLEIKLMDVLVEEKRNYMSLDTQSMYSYSNGRPC